MAMVSPSWTNSETASFILITLFIIYSFILKPFVFRSWALGSKIQLNQQDVLINCLTKLFDKFITPLYFRSQGIFNLLKDPQPAKSRPMLVKEKICKTIRKDIILGQLNPGEHLIESALCKKFKVSRSSIREALNMLMNEGFLTIIPNKGAIVSKISTKDLEDFYVLLALMERKAVEWATPCIKASEIEELILINESLKHGMISDNEDKLKNWNRQNFAFHRFFWKRCGNEKLGWLVEEIRKRIFRYLYTSLTVTSYDNLLKDHAAIIMAVKDKDVEKAGQTMENHILGALRALMEFFSHT